LGGGSIHLTWDDCYGGDGGFTKSFACDADVTQPFMLIASVIPPQGITQYVGHISVFELHFQSSPMPDWWSFGQCRASNSITASPPAGESSCPDLVDLPQFGGQDYRIRYQAPNRARLRSAYAINANFAGPLQSDHEAVVLRISVAGDRTTGPNACAGCGIGMCIAFNSLLLDQVDPNLPRGLVTSGEQQVAYWNGQGYFPCYTPTQPRTWGQLKSLYR